jgi:hypothetical protein
MYDRTATTSSEEHGRTLWLVTAIGAMFLLQCWFYRPYFGIDDSIIFQVYGSNLAHGYGWVYHAGAEHVEGTTSFLYTLLWGLSFLTPWPQLVMHLINLVCALAAFWTALRILQPLLGDVRYPRQIDVYLIVYLLWIALNPGALTWTTVALMDMSLWAFLVVAAVYVTCRFARDQDGAYYSKGMSLIGGIMVLTRPESLLLVPAMILLAAGISLASGSTARQALRIAAVPLTVFASLAVFLTLFRYFYFGYPFPNTYYAKVSPDRVYNIYIGLKYLSRFLRYCPLLLPLLAVAGFAALRAASQWIRGGKQSTDHLVLLAAVLPVFVILFIPILNGGDHFAQGRFFTPVVLLVPLPCLRLLPSGIDWPTSRGAQKAVMLLWVGLIVLTGRERLIAPRQQEEDLKGEFEIAEAGLQTGEILNRIFPGEAKPTVGVIAAGGIALTYDGYVIDVLGLNNTLVAHSGGGRYGVKNHASFSTQAFYRLSPDVFCVFQVTPESLAASKLWDESPGFDDGTHHIRTEAAFRSSYEKVELWFRDPAIGQPSSKLTGSGSALDRLMRPRLKQTVALSTYIKRDVADRLDPRIVEVRR